MWTAIVGIFRLARQAGKKINHPPECQSKPEAQAKVEYELPSLARQASMVVEGKTIMGKTMKKIHGRKSSCPSSSVLHPMVEPG